MALTRKMLAAMEIPEEKIGEIMSTHLATVDELKDERDQLKKDLADFQKTQKDLESVQKELDELKSGDWQKKYEDMKSEYDTYKADVETKAAAAAKADAYRKLLKDVGVSEKRFDAILRVTNLDDIKLDKDGAIEGADEITESVKTEWADFIVKQEQQGANTPKPPANNGGELNQPSRAAQLVKEYQAAHYGAKED